MSNPYVNGREVLPPDLLARVQEHCSGLVWIPAPDSFYRERRRLIRTLRAEGVATEEIARLAGISARRVNQIAAAETKGARGKSRAAKKSEK